MQSSEANRQDKLKLPPTLNSYLMLRKGRLFIHIQLLLPVFEIIKFSNQFISNFVSCVNLVAVAVVIIIIIIIGSIFTVKGNIQDVTNVTGTITKT